MKSPFAKISFAALAALQCAGFAMAAEGWTTDFEAAKKQAAAEHKNLLVDFTGSDWCIWCKRLDKEVFEEDAFKTGVKDKFVLVTLDFPNDKSKQSDEVKAQNKDLQAKYLIKGFPTIMLCDETGKPFAQTGYQSGGPEKYVKSLDLLITNKKTRDEALSAAEKAEGAAKGKLLYTALKAMKLDDKLSEAFYGDLPAQIKTLDPKDESGMAKDLAVQERIATFNKSAMALVRTKEYDAALALVDNTLKEDGFDMEAKQNIAMTKASCYMAMGKFDEAEKTCDEVIAMAPGSDTSAHIAEFKPNIAKMKEMAAKKAAASPEKKTEE